MIKILVNPSLLSAHAGLSLSLSLSLSPLLYGNKQQINNNNITATGAVDREFFYNI